MADDKGLMADFMCNICGAQCSVADLEWEKPSCGACGSNIRLRAIIAMLSRELFGRVIPLADFPVMRNVKGFGLSDHVGYAGRLAEKFDYVNTYYDREPFLDITAEHPELYGTYDFILASDVLEHVPMPIERTLDEMSKLLQPNGFLCITVPSSLEENTVEHYPDLHHHAIATLGEERILVNRRADGKLDIHENLVFHGGPGSTLELRLLSQKDLIRRLQAAGFSHTTREEDEMPQFGVAYNEWSRPIVARKGRYILPPIIVETPALASAPEPVDSEAILTQSEPIPSAELISRISELESELRAVRDSRWVKLGNAIGLGPRVRSIS